MDRVAVLGDALLLSVISRVELEGGVYADAALSAIRRRRLDELLRTLTIIPFDEEAAEAYGSIVQAAGFSRRKIVDRMIAAQALVQRATLVTINADDFKDIPGLQLLAW